MASSFSGGINTSLARGNGLSPPVGEREPHSRRADSSYSVHEDAKQGVQQPQHIRQSCMTDASKYLTPVDDDTDVLDGRSNGVHREGGLDDDTDRGGSPGVGALSGHAEQLGPAPQARPGQVDEDDDAVMDGVKAEGPRGAGIMSGSRARLMAELNNYKSRMRASGGNGSPAVSSASRLAHSASASGDNNLPLARSSSGRANGSTARSGPIGPSTKTRNSVQ